ncbi:MAG: hypothetical protein WD512_20675, partial [Candidatus Paceibacterota bacterium]
MMRSLNFQNIVMLLGVVLVVILIMGFSKNIYEPFADPTWCSPCEKQSSSDPTYCLSCDNCYYDNGLCRSINDDGFFIDTAVYP